MNQNARRLAPASRRVAAAGFVLVASLLSCGREITGPADGIRYARGLSFVSEFPGFVASVEEGAGDIVAFTRVRVLFRRLDGSVALDRTLNFPANQSQLSVSFDVPLAREAPTTGEELDLFLRYINATGDTVFAGGPVSVFARASRSGSVPEPAIVPLEYTGPGATATSVVIAPDSLALVAGDPFAFTATALDGQGVPVPDAPILWSSLDAARATIADPMAGAGNTAASRGRANIRAALVTGVAADTAQLIIAPKLQALSLTEGGNQTGEAGAPLPAPVRVRVLATDGLGIAGVEVAVLPSAGGQVPDSLVTSDSLGNVALPWTLGPTEGAQTLTFSTAGAANLVVNATATVPTTVATALEILTSFPEPQFSGSNFTPTLQVRAVDGQGALAAEFTGSVSLELVSGPPGGVLTGGTTANAVAGVASFNAWSATLVGSYTIRAVAGGLVPDTMPAFDVIAGVPDLITVIQGDGQTAFINEPLPLPIIVEVTDAAGNRVPGAPVNYSVTGGGGSVVGTGTTTDTLGRATLGQWTLGPTAGTNTLSVGVEGAGVIAITATAVNPPPEIVMNVVGSSVVGVGRTGTIRVRLLQPAPSNDFLVTLSSDSTQYLTFVEGNVLAFQSGQTELPIEVNGVAAGNAVLRADAAGYTSDTLVVPVSLNLITLPPTLNVPLAQTASLPVSLSAPAPAGGVSVALVSNNPGFAQPVLDTVFIPAGTQSVNVNVEGLALGTATITATNPNYAPDETNVSVTAGVDITAGTFAINESFGLPMTIRLVSGTSNVAAPPGGIALTLSSDDANCATVPSNAFIAEGLTSTTVQVVYGGVAVTPCSTRVRAFGPQDFGQDSATVNVAVQPVANITSTAVNLGSGLQGGISLTLGASNHGGTTVTFTSADSSKVLVAQNGTVVGAGTLALPVAIGNTSLNIFLQALEGITQDSLYVYASAPGFRTDSILVRIWQPVYDVIGVNLAPTTLSPDDPFNARIGTPSSATGALSSQQTLRAGADTAWVTFVSDTPSVATFVQTAGTADSIRVPIAAGASTSPSSVAAGGAAIRPLAEGVAPIRSSIPGFRPSGTAALINVTVSQPSISALSTVNVGSGLQRQGLVNLSQTSPDTVVVTLTFNATGSALLAPTDTAVGADTAQIVFPPGTSSRAFYVNALEGRLADTLTLSATAPGFTSRTSTVRVFQAVYEIIGLPTSATTLTADDQFQVRIGSPTTPTGSLSSTDPIRPGGPPLEVSVIADSVGVSTIVRNAIAADSQSYTLQPGENATPSSAGAGGFSLRFLAQGTSVVRASIPGLRALPFAVATTTVTAPNINNLSNIALGAGLQRQLTVTLAQAPADTVRVTVRPDTLGVILLAPNATTVGADSIVLTFVPGDNSEAIVYQALEGTVADTVVVTASAPGYNSSTGTIRVYQPVVEIVGLASSPTSLNANDDFQVRIGSPSSPTGNISSTDGLRAGSAGATITIATSNPTVAQLVTTTQSGDTVTLALAATANITPISVPSGGVALDPLTAGSTTVTASIPGFRPGATASQAVTVIPPALALSTTNATVGAGLQTGASGSLNSNNHGGIAVVVKSSNPAVLRVAPNGSTVATDSIVLNLNAGSTSFSFQIAGVEGATGDVTITASAPGFLDANVVKTVAAPFIAVNTNLAATQTGGGADDPFTISVGLPNASQTSLSVTQQVRAGASLAVTVASSDSTAGRLVSLTHPDGAPVTTVQISGGSSTTGSTVAGGGVAFRPLAVAQQGTTTVSATATGFSQVTSGQVVVTVNPP